MTTLPTDITRSGSGTLTFSLSCQSACAQGAAPVSVDIAKVAVLVNDTKAPYGSVNRNSPTNRFTQLIASAIEEGVGFSHADAMISTTPSDANVVLSKSVEFGEGECADLTAGDATIDLPLDSRCETGSGTAKFTTAFVPGDKPGDPPKEVVGTSLDTSGLPEGIYYRRVIAYDAVGNAQDLINSNGSVWEAFEVWHPVLGSPTQTLSIGSSSIVAPEPQPNVNPNQNGSQGNAATACRSPRLSVSLGQKPLRVSKCVAVLQYGKRYRFEGRLTCVVNGRRISAPKRTKVQLLNKVGKKTVTKTGPKHRRQGSLQALAEVPARLAHADLPVHQLDRAALAGLHQDQDRKEEEVREALSARTGQGEGNMKRYVALGAVLTALGAAGTAAVQGAAAGGSAAQAKDGGLSVMPALIEHSAQPGELATMTVANRSAAPLDVTVTPRPWVQSVTGKVSPNRRSTLSGVTVSQSKFTLAAGRRDEGHGDADLGALRRVPVRRDGGRRRADGRRHAQGRRARLPARRVAAGPARGARSTRSRPATSRRPARPR